LSADRVEAKNGRSVTNLFASEFRKEMGLNSEEAYILASNAVDLRITQLVDGKKGVHALLPKGIFLR
jgi:acetamidase/formamidase